MSDLVVYYDESPVDLKGRVEIDQSPISAAARLRAVEGAVRAALVYVRVHGETGPFLVPFGDYDDWSLRDRYNEAIRIMNTLGAAEITCETFQEVKKHKRFVARIWSQGADVHQKRLENSGFDFRHIGAGAAPRDPRPLRWPDEPGFSAAVTSVLESRATEVEFNIRTSRTHDVTGSLGLQLKKVGFELGGGSQTSGATSLHIRATFPSPKKGTW